MNIRFMPRRKREQRMSLVPDSSNKGILCYRDEETRTLFTWNGTPDDPFRIWEAGEHDPIDIDIFGTMVKSYLKTMEARLAEAGHLDPKPEDPLLYGWGFVMGGFVGWCEGWLTLRKEQRETDEIIAAMEKHFTLSGKEE